MSLLYYTIENFDEQLKKLETLTIGTKEYIEHLFLMYLSYGKKVILSKTGIEKGLELYNKFKNGETLNRDELFTLYLIGTEASLIKKEKNAYADFVKIHNMVFEKYKPDDGFLQAYLFNKLSGKGYLKNNLNYVEEMYDFLSIFIIINDQVIN